MRLTKVSVSAVSRALGRPVPPATGRWDPTVSTDRTPGRSQHSLGLSAVDSPQPIDHEVGLSRPLGLDCRADSLQPYRTDPRSARQLDRVG